MRFRSLAGPNANPERGGPCHRVLNVGSRDNMPLIIQKYDILKFHARLPLGEGLRPFFDVQKAVWLDVRNDPPEQLAQGHKA